MSKPKLHEFRIRMSSDLMTIIDDVKGVKSKNELINDWLWSKARGDSADRIADALRPLLASLDDEDRTAFVEHAIAAVEILATGRRRRRGYGDE